MKYIIGRDANTSQLDLISNRQTYRLGVSGSVPMTVSRQHCELTIDDAGHMSIRNLKPQNVTFVNGHPVESKSIIESDIITLGPSQYRLNLSEILTLVKKSTPKIIDIRPLKQVWDEYDAFILEHQISTQRLYALASTTGLFFMGAVIISFIPGVNQMWRILMYIAAVILVVLTAIKRYNDSNWPLLKKQKDLELHKRYVCPNCHQFLAKPYDLLLQGNCCPYCKAKFKK